ncbi:hypothetical protein [Novosphingobium resinovorum]|uniref:hypothetical protein n=1 Tax=Novosphingobium resinovorum TaxID=158500 RepID=UPI002ED3D47C|nr:hypothetical protein [Novosphingobium resinovorum]
MADAAFALHALPGGAPDDGMARLFAAPAPGWRMLSAEGPAEAVLLTHGAANAAALAGIPGVAQYQLEQVSDSGPSAEPFGIIMMVAFDVPPDRTAEVDRWYDEEHIGLLMKADGWLRARRYRVLSHHGGPRWTSLAFHELRDITVMASPERAFARSTAWRARLEQEPWFPAAGRGVFRPMAVPD